LAVVLEEVTEESEVLAVVLEEVTEESAVVLEEDMAVSAVEVMEESVAEDFTVKKSN
jgi:hypothetical protein